MKIELRGITVRELIDGYRDDGEEGVFGYGGRLDIRPPYQREFIYDRKERDAVIDSVSKGFPIGVMYWNVRDDGSLEVIDGQQRIVSICQFVHGDFSFDKRLFSNLQRDEREQLLNYELVVYFCRGTDSERLAWFKTINIAGKKLTDQELRNATYAGPWVTDAKGYFSKIGCPAQGIGGGDYLTGTTIRQDYLETALDWISQGNIEDYMARHQHDSNAEPLWNHFYSVIEWIQTVFPVKRREMKYVDWGELYDDFNDHELDPEELEAEVSRLMGDEDVTKKSGVYAYVLDRDERHLNLRTFSNNQKREAYERHNGLCAICGEHFNFGETEADHMTPWHEGGKTLSENCQILCKEDNRRKSGK